MPILEKSGGEMGKIVGYKFYSSNRIRSYIKPLINFNELPMQLILMSYCHSFRYII